MESYDQHMLFSSPARNNWFYKQIKETCNNKVCLDIGTGSGVLSLFALHSGATHVYMIDSNPECCNLASNVMNHSGMDPQRYTIINEEFNSNSLKNLKNIDVVISELVTSNLFGIDLEKIYSTIKQNDKTRDAILIPDTIRGTFSIFKNIEMFDTIDAIRKQNKISGLIKTGVEEIDRNYSYDVSLFISDFFVNDRYCVRPFLKSDRSDYVHLLKLYDCALNSTVGVLKNVITFDMHHPDINKVWRASSNLENGDYGAMLIGTLSCSQIKNSTTHLMNQDVWATYFYKFSKTKNDVNIRFDRTKRDFIFFE